MRARFAHPCIDPIARFTKAVGDIQQFIEDHSATGGYYAPTVETGERHGHGGYLRPFLRVEFPNSTITITDDYVIVVGMRGSIQDVIIPLIVKAGLDPDDPRWDVVTSRPDVTWHKRCPRREEAPESPQEEFNSRIYSPWLPRR